MHNATSSHHGTPINTVPSKYQRKTCGQTQCTELVIPSSDDLLQVLKAVSIEGRSFVELYLPQDFQGKLQWDTMD